MDHFWKLFICFVALLSARASVAEDNAGDVANALVSALTNFVEANSEEMSEEVLQDIEEVKTGLEQQQNRSEELEIQMQEIAEHAMGIDQRCGGVVAGQYCFVLHNQKQVYQGANMTCMRKNSKLADISNIHQYDHVMEYVMQHDVMTDRSVVYAWTRMHIEDLPTDSVEVDGEDHFAQWLPSFPRRTPNYEHVAWQIVSSQLFADNGFLNVPNEATAYPLCQHKLEKVCPNNQVYQECGTACPLYCGRENPDACIEECQEGCRCPFDTPYLTRNGRCVAEENCPDPAAPTTTTEEAHITTTTAEPTTTSQETTTTTEEPTTTTSGSPNYAQLMLTAHNDFRALHGVDPLQLDDDLNRNAQAWADHLANIDQMVHAQWSERPGQGENLARWWALIDTIAQDATSAWYNEEELYDYNDPGFSGATGHFTQVVWRRSTHLGVGVAVSSSGRAYVVARYSPSGNYLGQFADNVPRPL